MSKIQNITVKNGEYTNGAGETKADWQHIGRLVTHDGGKQSIYIDFIPTNWDGKAYVFSRTAKKSTASMEQETLPMPESIAAVANA